MTEQDRKAKFKQAVDHTLSGLTGDPYLFQRVAAKAEKGEKHVKYHIPKGVLIALIALLCMGTVAVAAGVYGGTTNWSGEIIYDERPEMANPTMPPEEMEAQIDAMVYIADLTARLESDGELLVIYETMEDGEVVPSTNTSLKRSAKDIETFKSMLDGAENLPQPKFIPEGYEFVEGEVYYTCRAGGEWKLAHRQELEGGVLVERYQLDATDALIRGYYMLFRNSPEDYHYLAVNVDLMELRDASEQSFGFTEYQTVRVIDVPGMDNAIAITSDHGCSLSMRRVLEETVEHLQFRDGEWQEQLSYGEISIDVSAPLLDIDTLIRMFSTE